MGLYCTQEVTVEGIRVALVTGLSSAGDGVMLLEQDLSDFTDEVLGRVMRLVRDEHRIWAITARLEDENNYGFENLRTDGLLKRSNDAEDALVFYTSGASSFENVPEIIDSLKDIRRQIQSALTKRSIVPASRIPKPGYIYLLRAVSPQSHYKIGLSKNPASRISHLGVTLPFPIEPTHQFPTNDMFAAESRLHQQYADKRVNGEWFELSGQDVADICAIKRLEV